MIDENFDFVALVGLVGTACDLSLGFNSNVNFSVRFEF